MSSETALQPPATATLHPVVHQVVLRERRADDSWGSPLDTALAASALAAHAEEYHDEARAAVRRVRRSLDDGELTLSGRDTCALALCARAAYDLDHRDRALEDAATERLGELLEQQLTLAALHAAFIAWALGALCEDRARGPWPALREYSEAIPARGTDEALVALARAFSSDRLNEGQLVQRLIAASSRPTGLTEMCVLTWALDRALAEAVRSLPRTDNALQFLLSRRTDLLERLGNDVGLATFDPPTFEEFDPEAEQDPLMGFEHLSLFEATMLDWVLAPRATTEAIVTLSEAEHLFGERARTAEEQLTTARATGWRHVAAAALVGAALAGGLAAAVADASGTYTAERLVAIGGLTALIAVLPVLYLRAQAKDGKPTAATWTFVIAVVLTGLFIYADQTRENPTLDDQSASFAAQIIITVVATAIAHWVSTRNKD